MRVDRCAVALERLKSKYPAILTTGFRDSIRLMQPGTDIAELPRIIPDGYFWRDDVLFVFEIDVTHRTSFDKWMIYDELADDFQVRAFSVDEFGAETEVCLDSIVVIWATERIETRRLATLLDHSRNEHGS